MFHVSAIFLAFLQLRAFLASLLWTGSGLLRITNNMPNKAWGGITYPFRYCNGSIIEVWEWIGDFIPHFIRDAITYPCGDESYFMPVRGPCGHNDDSVRVSPMGPSEAYISVRKLNIIVSDNLRVALYLEYRLLYALDTIRLLSYFPKNWEKSIEFWKT